MVYHNALYGDFILTDFNDEEAELLRQARTIKSEADDTVRRVEERHQLYLKQLVGEIADRAKRDRSEAEKCLSHTDKNVRIVGLSVLIDVWHAADTEFLASCERMIFHDSDQEVKAVAINCLSKCFEATNDQRVVQIFASLVKDELQVTELRTAAYFALLTVTGELERRPELILDFTFPNDVDWSLMNRIH